MLKLQVYNKNLVDAMQRRATAMGFGFKDAEAYAVPFPGSVHVRGTSALAILAAVFGVLIAVGLGALLFSAMLKQPSPTEPLPVVAPLAPVATPAPAGSWILEFPQQSTGATQ